MTNFMRKWTPGILAVILCVGMAQSVFGHGPFRRDDVSIEVRRGFFGPKVRIQQNTRVYNPRPVYQYYAPPVMVAPPIPTYQTVPAYPTYSAPPIQYYQPAPVYPVPVAPFFGW